MKEVPEGGPPGWIYTGGTIGLVYWYHCDSRRDGWLSNVKAANRAAEADDNPAYGEVEQGARSCCRQKQDTSGATGPGLPSSAVRPTVRHSWLFAGRETSGLELSSGSGF